MVFVKARKGESTDSLIRKFTRKISEADLMREIREGKYFKPASEIKKEKRKNRRNSR